MTDRTRAQPEITPDTPLRLADAVKIAFATGGMTVTGLRRERDRHRLVIEKIAGKEFKTLAHIERMRQLCRDEAREPDCRRQSAAMRADRSTWIIRDNGRDVSTGCAADEIAAAEAKLRDFIAAKYTPKRSVRHIDNIPLADVLSIYLDAQLDKLRNRFNVDSEHEDTIAAIRKSKKRIERLNAWWGGKNAG